jgi:hypothetical protein
LNLGLLVGTRDRRHLDSQPWVGAPRESSPPPGSRRCATAHIIAPQAAPANTWRSWTADRTRAWGGYPASSGNPEARLEAPQGALQYTALAAEVPPRTEGPRPDSLFDASGAFTSGEGDEIRLRGGGYCELMRGSMDISKLTREPELR